MKLKLHSWGGSSWRWSVAAAFVLTACGGGSLPNTVGSVRVVNATSEYTTIDVVTGSKTVASGTASYAISAYTELDPGSTSFSLRAGGSTSTAATVTGTVVKKDHATLVAYTSGGTLTATVLSDQEGAPGKGNGKLRVFNTASTEAGAVDVYLTSAACSNLAGSTTAAVANSVAGLQSAYSEIAAANAVHVCVTATGDKSDVRLDIPSFTLADQQITTLILARGAGGVLLNGLRLDQQGALTKTLNASARVRVVASLSSAGLVSATVNGTAVTVGFASPAVGPYKLIGAGTLTVVVNGVDVPVTASTAAAGADLTLLVTGTATAPVAFAINDDNTASTSPSRPVRIRLVNGLNGVTGVATLIVDNAPVGDGAVFGAASSTAAVSSSAALTRLDLNYDGVTRNLGNTFTLTSGAVYTQFLLGTVALPVDVLRADR